MERGRGRGKVTKTRSARKEVPLHKRRNRGALRRASDSDRATIWQFHQTHSSTLHSDENCNRMLHNTQYHNSYSVPQFPIISCTPPINFDNFQCRNINETSRLNENLCTVYSSDSNNNLKQCGNSLTNFTHLNPLPNIPFNDIQTSLNLVYVNNLQSREGNDERKSSAQILNDNTLFKMNLSYLCD